MPNLPIQFQNKINSPELLAFLQQFGEESYVDAELINKFRDGINELYYSLNPDRILTLGTETIEDNEYTYIGYSWQIQGESFVLSAPTVLTIPFATPGFKRKDISVFTVNGTIVRVAGTETDGEIVATPDVPEGALYYKSYDIDGGSIEVDPEPPAIDGSIYKQKIENTRWKSTQSGSNVVIPFQAAGQMHYSVVNSGLISVAGFSTANLTGPLYEGVDVLFENQTGNAITLKNMFGGILTPVKFNFGADLAVPDGGKLWMRVRNREFELIMKSWVDIDLSTKADLVDGKVPASQLPSYVDDVLEFANLAAFPATGETGKIYVALDTNLQYRWSGSAYVQIGGGKKTHVVKIAGVFSSGETRWIKSTAYDSFLQPTNSTDVTAGFSSDNNSISSHAVPFAHKIVGCFFNCFNVVAGTTNLDVAVVSFEFPDGGINGLALRTNSTLLARKNITFGSSISPNFKFIGTEVNNLYNGNENALIKLYIKNLSAPTVGLTSFQYCLTLLVEEI